MPTEELTEPIVEFEEFVKQELGKLQSHFSSPVLRDQSIYQTIGNLRDRVITNYRQAARSHQSSLKESEEMFADMPTESLNEHKDGIQQTFQICEGGLRDFVSNFVSTIRKLHKIEG